MKRALNNKNQLKKLFQPSKSSQLLRSKLNNQAKKVNNKKLSQSRKLPNHPSKNPLSHQFKSHNKRRRQSNHLKNQKKKLQRSQPNPLFKRPNPQSWSQSPRERRSSQKAHNNKVNSKSNLNQKPKNNQSKWSRNLKKRNNKNQPKSSQPKKPKKSKPLARNNSKPKKMMKKENLKSAFKAFHSTPMKLTSDQSSRNAEKSSTSTFLWDLTESQKDSPSSSSTKNLPWTTPSNFQELNIWEEPWKSKRPEESPLQVVKPCQAEEETNSVNKPNKDQSKQTRKSALQLCSSVDFHSTQPQTRSWSTSLKQELFNQRELLPTDKLKRYIFI